LANSLPDGINLFGNDVQKAIYFLKKIGVKHEDGFGHPRFLPDLSILEKKTLTSELVKKFLNENKNPSLSMGNLLITNYLLPQFKDYPEIYDAKDFSTMINACGRMNLPSIGIACCVHRTNEMILRGIETSKKYSEKLQEGITWLIEGNKFTHLKAIEAFDGEDKITETIVGVICTILIDSSEYENSLAVDTSKPIIGYSHSDSNNFKVSARCTDRALQNGVDLSQAIRITCANLGIKSKGGGHPPAAGAYIPKNSIRQFLSELDHQVQIQLGEEKEDTKTKSKKASEKTSNKKNSKKSTIPKKTTPKSPLESKAKQVSKNKSKGLDQFWG
jgi:RecJ-like exonuclease